MDVGKLVPGRDCGDCTVCCVVPVIDEPEIQKAGSAPCRHCARGCAIYDSRPQVCRAFYCGWRQLDFGDEWRPDRSGVFIMLEEIAAAGAPPVMALTFMLIAQAFKVLHTRAFVDLVRDRALQGWPIFVALPPKPGFKAKRVRIRDAAVQEAARTDIGWLETLLEQGLRLIHAQSYEPYALRHSGQDVST
jgi:hypothetical protein